jgi:xylulokinase
MRGMDLGIDTVRAGGTNMFLSPLFGETFATVTGTAVELYDTDGSQGAARGAGLGAGIYSSTEEAFVALKRVRVIEPDPELAGVYDEAYARWREVLMSYLD